MAGFKEENLDRAQKIRPPDKSVHWKAIFSILIFIQKHLLWVLKTVTYIRVLGNSKEIPILNSNCSVVLLTQVNEGESISFIYTIRLYGGFAIHSVISLLFTKTFNTFTNTEIV